MRKKVRIAFFISVVLAVIGFMSYQFISRDLILLDAKGTIARQQADLLIFATLLSMVVILPVFALTIFIALKYRETNKKSKYKPEFHHSRLLESIWWGIPIAIIGLLSVITWVTTHSLDPHKPLESQAKPLNVQVVALQWKWLFIYPEQDIATVNYLAIPEDRPINFQITADAPMNSFWIPQLGGQIYAMPGMATKLHLMADEPGEYSGYSANISGEGFAKMKFVTKSMTDADFNSWSQEASSSSASLSGEKYEELRSPNTTDQITYSSTEDDLFNSIIDRYGSHASGKAGSH